MTLTADDFDRLSVFLQNRLADARAQLPADARDAALALDALHYEIARAAGAVGLLRAGVPDPRVADAWETLRHMARLWKDHADFEVAFALPSRDLSGATGHVPLAG
ncbi:hypothetical protein [Streptomyces sp. NPDC050264]|uniref:hypothetical protein n=1 Tax=Streptomyces sp. NPDC050264 TaxID=3155038 RepID=UPI0034379EA5